MHPLCTQFQVSGQSGAVISAVVTTGRYRRGEHAFPSWGNGVARRGYLRWGLGAEGRILLPAGGGPPQPLLDKEA